MRGWIPKLHEQDDQCGVEVLGGGTTVRVLKARAAAGLSAADGAGVPNRVVVAAFVEHKA